MTQEEKILWLKKRLLNTLQTNKSLKEENERLEKEFKEIDKSRIERINQAIQDGLAIQKEVDSLKQLNSELVECLKYVQTHIGYAMHQDFEDKIEILVSKANQQK